MKKFIFSVIYYLPELFLAELVVLATTIIAIWFMLMWAILAIFSPGMVIDKAYSMINKFENEQKNKEKGK